ncbi:septal ring lytic transglycosylase RlpA family protein [Azohydromonas lata]|uniref:Endolytic peptidoglycan transglycosylase RlpA n=1 Tax=Azohydromonas lata TaxID=45677 RepID=A0ABU5IG60_9BURK|nr:septal ring lytic transglycosylase RlpA family protein [Azohydromonas lata]MDZ5458110.1 septal ring lytic transglycosylase RlpA family protein [Azohydromonas lata]
MQRSTKRLALLLALLAGCATGPSLADTPAAADTPAQVPQDLVQGTAATPADLAAQPADAAERPAPSRSLLSQLLQRGRASWYAHHFHGRRTASGERYDRTELTAAHRTLPLNSYARVRNPANGREVVVRINDRGPFNRGHVIDVSHAAAARLGILGSDREVEIEPLANGGARHASQEPTASRLVPTSFSRRVAARTAAKAAKASTKTAAKTRTTTTAKATGKAARKPQLAAVSAPSHKLRRHRLTDRTSART